MSEAAQANPAPANDAFGGDADNPAETVTGKRLRSFVERIERLEEEKKALAEDIKEVYGEAKGVGFDVKTMRKIISLRKMEEHKREEEEHLLDTYKAAMGMV